MNTAEYLIKQLERLGITDIFGLPGDYNFDILYALGKNPNVRWIGCTNELNAGYAADGYARQRGYGAIITTYGVGELSAANAIAGSRPMTSSTASSRLRKRLLFFITSFSLKLYCNFYE